MSERLEHLWEQVEETKRTKGIHHPDFDRALRTFRLEKRRYAGRERAESRGSAANGFGPDHSSRASFGARDRGPNPNDV